MPRRTNPFQKLATWLQEALHGTEALIEESAMVPDLEGGGSIELDILVSFEKAGTLYRVGFECRNHNRRASRDWIRDLNTKRNNCRLDKIIAVHSTGFSRPAIRLAERLQIPTYTLREVEVATNGHALNIEALISAIKTHRIISYRAFFASVPPGVDVQSHDRYLYLADHTSRYPLSAVGEDLVLRTPAPDLSLTPGASRQLAIGGNVEPGQYFMRSGEVFLEVRRLEFLVEFVRAKPYCGSTAKALHSAVDDRKVGEIAAVSLPMGNEVAVLGCTRGSETHVPELFINLPQNVDLDDFSAMFDVITKDPDSQVLQRHLIPLSQVDSHGNPLRRVALRGEISIDHEGPEDLPAEKLKYVEVGKSGQLIELRRLVRDAAKRQLHIPPSLSPGEKRKATLKIVPETEELSLLADGLNGRRHRIRSIEVAVDYWVEPEAVTCTIPFTAASDNPG